MSFALKALTADPAFIQQTQLGLHDGLVIQIGVISQHQSHFTSGQCSLPLSTYMAGMHNYLLLLFSLSGEHF